MGISLVFLLTFPVALNPLKSMILAVLVFMRLVLS